MNELQFFSFCFIIGFLLNNLLTCRCLVLSYFCLIYVCFYFSLYLLLLFKPFFLIKKKRIRDCGEPFYVLGWITPIVPQLGLSMSQSGSGLCPTRNRPDQIRWWSSKPADDSEKQPVKSDRAQVGSDRLWFQPKYKDQTLKFDSWRTKSTNLQTQRTDP